MPLPFSLNNISDTWIFGCVAHLVTFALIQNSSHPWEPNQLYAVCGCYTNTLTADWALFDAPDSLWGFITTTTWESIRKAYTVSTDLVCDATMNLVTLTSSLNGDNWPSLDTEIWLTLKAVSDSVITIEDLINMQLLQEVQAIQVAGQNKNTWLADCLDLIKKKSKTWYKDASSKLDWLKSIINIAHNTIKSMRVCACVSDGSCVCVLLCVCVCVCVQHSPRHCQNTRPTCWLQANFLPCGHFVWSTFEYYWPQM